MSRIKSRQKSAFPTLTSSMARGGFTGSESSIIMAGWLHWAVHCHHLSIQLTFHHISNSLRPSVWVLVYHLKKHWNRKHRTNSPRFSPKKLVAWGPQKKTDLWPGPYSPLCWTKLPVARPPAFWTIIVAVLGVNRPICVVVQRLDASDRSHLVSCFPTTFAARLPFSCNPSVSAKRKQVK